MPDELSDVLSATAAIETAAMASLGLRRVYNTPPEALEIFPCSVRYARSGSLTASKGFGRHNLHHFIIEVHLERARPGGLQITDALARPFVEKFHELYAANLSLNGTCEYCTFEDVSYEAGGLSWGKVDTYGIRFYLWAKVQGAITVEL